MVLINEKKYACATCIKGHRVSGCTHTDRPLFEVKKKGRPVTQCSFCRDKRKGSQTGGSVHTKCACEELKNQTPSTIFLGAAPGSGAAAVAAANAANGANGVGGTGVAGPSTVQLHAQLVPPPTASPVREVVETKKGVPGSTPTFPNGLRDVHEMAAAAEALTGLGGENNQAAERRLQNLLNPCHCQTTGKCKCCAPRRSAPSPRRRTPPRPAHIDTQLRGDPHAQVTDSLIEMFKAKATTVTPSEGPASAAPSGSTTPNQPPTSPFSGMRNLNLSMTSANSNILASPDSRHHPAYTSPHVHRTRLYSPYATNGNSPRHGKPRSESVSSTSSLGPGWTSSSASGPSPRPPPPRIRPLADMNKFLGAVFKEDGSVATEIPRSALGLPGIDTFDAAAREGSGSGKEDMDVDPDAVVSFPTNEDVVIGACTCGDGCECPGCATHSNHASSSSPKGDHDHACGDSCKSCFDCADHLSIPSGVRSIEQLIQLAAANVPSNPPRARVAAGLNPHDTRILPPAAQMSEDAARAFGLVQLRPLECCNGRCQCAPGECSCDKECCGCCTRCACDEDGDTLMTDGDHPMPDAKPMKPGCCSTKEPPSPQLRSASSQASASHQLLVPQQTSRQPSPGPGGMTTTPPNGSTGVRRAASVSRAKEASNSGPGSRRVSLSNTQGAPGVQRSTSLGSKSNAKLLALHTNPHHPRPILPKPLASGSANGNRLTLPRSNGSRQPSPGQRSSCSSHTSRGSSPAMPPVALPVPQGEFSLATQEEAAEGDRGNMAIGVDDIASALASSEIDFTAYLNQLLSPDNTTEGGGDAATILQQQQQQTPQASQNVPDFSMLGLQSPSLENSMGDIQEMIAGALAQQGLFGGRMDPNANLAAGGQQQPAADYSYFFGIAPDAAMPAPDEMPAVSSQTDGKQQQQQQQQMYYQLAVNGMPNGGLSPNTMPNGGLSPNTMPNGGLSPNTMPQPQPAPGVPGAFIKPDGSLFFPQYPGGFPQAVAPGVPTMPPDMRREVSPQHAQQQQQQQVHPQQHTQQAQQHAQPQQQVQQPQQQHAQPQQAPSHTNLGGANPDIIDLSKPLNPTDVDRILQALMKQQPPGGGDQHIHVPQVAGVSQVAVQHLQHVQPITVQPSVQVAPPSAQPTPPPQPPASNRSVSAASDRGHQHQQVPQVQQPMQMQHSGQQPVQMQHSGQQPVQMQHSGQQPVQMQHSGQHDPNATALFDQFMFDPNLAVEGQQAAVPPGVDREWLEKAWAAGVFDPKAGG